MEVQFVSKYLQSIHIREAYCIERLTISQAITMKAYDRVVQKEVDFDFETCFYSLSPLEKCIFRFLNDCGSLDSEEIPSACQ